MEATTILYIKYFLIFLVGVFTGRIIMAIQYMIMVPKKRTVLKPVEEHKNPISVKGKSSVENNYNDSTSKYPLSIKKSLDTMNIK